MICARAAVYASPVFCIRARTRRLRSLLRGIVNLLWVHHGPPPSSAPMATQRFDDTIRRYALLCLVLDSGWGRILRGLAWIDAGITMASLGPGVKHDKNRPVAFRARA